MTAGQGSYQIKTIAINVEKEINRLGAQVDLFWEKEIKHYEEFGLRDGLHVVELGSGPGFVTEKILRRYPNARVTCAEIEPILADYARQHLVKQGLSDRCQVFERNIMQTELPDDTFDFAITRLVLEHLPDPVSAVAEVFRILKPGGKAVFVDNDFEMHILTYPPIFELRELYDAYCESRFAEGGNPKIGRELPRILKAGGFFNVDFEVITAHSDLLGDQMFFASEGIGIPSKLVADGFLSSKSLGKIAVAWRNMVRNEGHTIVRQLFLAAGEKVVEKVVEKGESK